MLTVRELKASDIELVADYWFGSTRSYLHSIGVDTEKMPEEEEFTDFLAAQLETPYEDKESYCIIWELDGVPVGHCNTNPTAFGNEAFMHLHLWNPGERRKGLGLQFLKLSLPYFFKNLRLKKLICEPYAQNTAPHRTLEKAGFEFVKEYSTTPGLVNFEQDVKRWELTIQQFENM